MDLFRGAFNGRFYQLQSPLPEGPLGLIHRGLPGVLSTDPIGTRWRLGWCGPDPLGLPDLLESDDGGGSCWQLEDGVARMWIRIEEAHVPTAALKRAWEKEAVVRHGVKLAHVPTAEREELKERITRQLRARVIVKVKILPLLLLGDGLLWMGRHPVSPVVQTLVGRLLGNTLGPVPQAPMIWAVDDLQWFAYHTAVLMQLRHGVTQLSPSVTVSELRLQGTDFRLRTSADTDRYLPMLQALLGVEQLPTVTHIGLQVMMNGEPTVLRIDETGLCWAFPPLSTGGLLAERVLRRLDDVSTACELAKEALQQAIDDVHLRDLTEEV